MTEDLIQRYQPGGDIYVSLTKKYSLYVAQITAQAALSGDEPTINAAMVNAIYGPSLNDSTLSNFTELLVTDPFGAPLDALNKIAKNSFLDIFRSKAVIAAAVIGLFLYFDGVTLVKNLINNKK